MIKSVLVYSAADWRMVSRIEQLRYLPRVKHSLDSARTEVREGRLIQLCWAHPSGLRQVVNHQVDEVNPIRS